MKQIIYNTTLVVNTLYLSLAGIDWLEYRRQLKKAEQWNVEVY